MKKLDDVHEEILGKITPTPVERARLSALAEELRRKVKLACEEQGVKATVRVEGSIAKDTWLREEPEIDVFMRLPITMPRKVLGEIGLKIARKATAGARQIERFAEHPYLEAFIDDVRLNIVPCYDVKKGEWLSATDRTPFHTDYIKKCLNKDMRGEVRLLKKFLQAIDAYGAEIKTGGFSGYLCELLIVYHKSFIETLRTFSGYAKKLAIDIEGYYESRQKELDRLFPESLVIVDPVDGGRNVGSAVQPQKLYLFVAAARAFLKNPSPNFFYPPEISALPTRVLAKKLEKRGGVLLFLKLGKINTVPDVLWGQLYKTQRALRKLAELNDFTVLRDAVWSDEKTLHIFVFELEQRVLPSIKKHFGPPLERERECERFLAKYARNSCVVSGPYIEDGRLVVELRRRLTDVIKLFKEKLVEGGRNFGVAELISQAFRKKLDVLVSSEVIDVYRSNGKFAEFLSAFLSGKPFWLDFAEA